MSYRRSEQGMGNHAIDQITVEYSDFSIRTVNYLIKRRTGWPKHNHFIENSWPYIGKNIITINKNDNNDNNNNNIMMKIMVHLLSDSSVTYFLL